MTLIQILLPPAIMFTIVYVVAKVFKLNPTRYQSSNYEDGFIDGFFCGHMDEDQN
jgi:hypothetical protein